MVEMKSLERVLNRHNQKLRSSLVESTEFSRVLMAGSKPIVSMYNIVKWTCIHFSKNAANDLKANCHVLTI